MPSWRQAWWAQRILVRRAGAGAPRPLPPDGPGHRPNGSIIAGCCPSWKGQQPASTVHYTSGQIAVAHAAPATPCRGTCRNGAPSLNGMRSLAGSLVPHRNRSTTYDRIGDTDTRDVAHDVSRPTAPYTGAWAPKQFRNCGSYPGEETVTSSTLRPLADNELDFVTGGVERPPSPAETLGRVLIATALLLRRITEPRRPTEF